MAALTELVADIRAAIPEIPTFVAERQILRAARTFCQETRAWRVDFLLSVTGSVSTVLLTSQLPANTNLVDVISMKNTGGGAPVKPTTFSWLDKNRTDWRSETDLNAAYYVRDTNNTLRLVPTPSTTTASLYDLRVAVMPNKSATALDDLLVNRYDEVIISGALAHLYLLPRKPWTDLNLAQYHQQLFTNSLPQVRAEAADDFQVGVPRKVKYGGI